MMTPQMQAAYEELNKLKSDIAQAQSNLKVLEAIGNGNTIALRADLNKAIARRDEVMRVIEQQAGVSE